MLARRVGLPLVKNLIGTPESEAAFTFPAMVGRSATLSSRRWVHFAEFTSHTYPARWHHLPTGTITFKAGVHYCDKGDKGDVCTHMRIIRDACSKSVD